MNRKAALMVLAWGLSFALVNAAENNFVQSLPRAHAHNDYEHSRPLLDALDHGFGSVEADVWLVNGALLVAHNLKDAKPERTLQKLYLDPLRERVRANGGRVYRGGPSLLLLIDVKSDATNTWRALTNVLAGYAPMLTRFTTNRIETNAVTAIISGNRARPLLEAEPVRFAALDGRLPDLDGGAPVSLIPLVSDTATKLSTWKGRAEDGPFPEADRKKLLNWVAMAHAQGRIIRFWGTPDTVPVWREFESAGVDLLNADDLAGLKEFLLKTGRR